MPWTLVGEPTITAATEAVELGPVRVSLEGGLAVKVSLPDSPEDPYGYMVISYISSYGEELGRIQLWPRESPTAYLLGAGLKVRDPFGALLLKAGNLNRRWLQAGHSYAVRVLADLPAPGLTDPHTPPGFADAAGRELSFTGAGGAARIAFPP